MTAMLASDDRYLITAAVRGNLTCGRDFYLVRGVRVHSATTIDLINRLLDAGFLEFGADGTSLAATDAGREALR